MSELDSRVSVNVSLADTVVTQAGFGTVLIFGKHGNLGIDRVVTYDDFEGLKADFVVGSQVYQAANALFSQEKKVSRVKVGRQEAAETVTEGLNACLEFVSGDFYGVMNISRATQDHKNSSAWSLSNKKLFGYSSEDSDIVTNANNDLMSIITSLNNNRSFGMWHHEAGIELPVVDTLTVTTTNCTALVTAGVSSLRLGDKIGVIASPITLEATYTITNINEGNNTFDFEVPAGTASTVDPSSFWIRNTYPEMAWFGKMFPEDAGAKTWDLQVLAAIAPSNAYLDATKRGYIGTKKGNWFTKVGGVNITGGAKTGGGGGKTHSGRYIDLQRGMDWLAARVQETTFTLMINGGKGYDALGLGGIETALSAIMNQGIDLGFLTTFVTGEFSGLKYFIQMPSLATVPTADKINRLLAGIKIFGNVRGKIHNVEIVINLTT